MNHPLFKTVNFLAYLGSWVFLCTLNILLFSRSGVIPIEYVCVDAAITHVWFAIIGLSLWFFISHLWSHKLSFVRILIIQKFAALAVISIWLLGSYAVLSTLFGDDPIYLSILHQSMLVRAGVGLVYYILIALTYFLFLLAHERRSRMNNEDRLRESLKESELNLLKSQINPHFLFNSLNSASLLTLTAPERAHEMIVALSEYLRYSISGTHGSFATLGTELENVRRYVEIEKIRFGDKLDLQFEIDPACTQHMVPSMILQPLYENAIKHGVYEATSKVWIRTTISYSDSLLQIEIANSFEPGSAVRKGAGLGLRNVRERLGMLYGTNEAWLQIERQPTIFTVKLFIPRNAK